MKLWYQSLARHDAFGPYAETLRRQIPEWADPGTEIAVHGLTKRGGVADQFRYLEHIESREVLDNLHRAMAEGFDAFMIGNITDAGLREAREVADIPVLGLCETALHWACMMGAAVSFVTINDKFTPRIVENVTRYKLDGHFAGVRRMQVDRLLDLNEGFAPGAGRDRMVAQFMEAADACVDAGAEVVIAAGGVVMSLLDNAGVHGTTKGATVLNGIVALVKSTEAAVKMNRLMGGRFTSRAGLYARPDPSLIPEIRKYYGADVYPTLD